MSDYRIPIQIEQGDEFTYVIFRGRRFIVTSFNMPWQDPPPNPEGRSFIATQVRCKMILGLMEDPPPSIEPTIPKRRWSTHMGLKKPGR